MILGAVMLARKLRESKQPFIPQRTAETTAVTTIRVENGTSGINIVSSGQLLAKRRNDIYAEARGVLLASGKEFRPGVYYQKGELIFRIEDEQEQASLLAQKSNLFNQIVALLPDLRLDYPESFGHWDAYVKAFDVKEPLAELPEPISERERLFLAGRNIYNSYYSTVTLEKSLKDFRILAPISGIITEAMVQAGTMVSPGQQLGSMLDPSVYELEVPVNVQYLELLKVGEPVELSNITHSARFQGKVARINGRVDRETQTITVYVEVSSKDLKEGMYLEASIEGRQEQNTFEVSRKLLVNDSEVFVVKDTTLHLMPVNPVHYKENTVIVRGLEDGTAILAQPVPGAYPGMPVRVISESNSTSSTE